MRNEWGTKTLILVAAVFMAAGLAAGAMFGPRVEPEPTAKLPAAESLPGVATERAQAGHTQRALPNRDEGAVRLAAAAAALSRVPQLQTRPEAAPAPHRPHRLALEELPPAVQQVVKQLTLGRKVTKPEFETRERNGQRYFKAEFLVEGVETEYALDEQGKVLASEVDMDPAELPSPVASGIQAALPGAMLLEAERNQVGDDKIFYEVEIRHQGQQMEVHVGEDGRILDQRVR